MIIDSFAGGGGASTGIELALGRSPDVAINHNAEALAMHARNHPRTVHLVSDVWEVDPIDTCKGRPVDLLWASPDCRHFSRAKGGKPASPKVRSLAWVVTRWAKAVRPRVIILENVPEFATWGPLHADGTPDKARMGLTFRRWLGTLKAAGYVVEMRELRACDYGAPTSRKRLFIIARCDGAPIVWPAPTHGPGTGTPWRTAADCIDWTLPVPSIFDRKRPLAGPTLARIARGLKRFVIGSSAPFVVPMALGLAAPTLIQTGYGEREGQEPRSLDIREPLGTVVAGGAKHALVTAFLAKHYGGHEGPGSDLRSPLDTVTAVDHHALVTATLGTRRDQVHAFIATYFGASTGQQLGLPVATMTTRDRFGLVTVRGQDYEIADIGMRMLQPHELFAAQGFPKSYDITAKTKTAQVRLAGNSVCPPIAAALVRANVAQDARRAA